MLEFCKSTGLKVLNGRNGLDKDIGKYTCINKQGSSVIDMVLAKSNIFHLVHSFELDEPNILSDHSFLTFSLKSCVVYGNVCMSNTEDIDYMYKWNTYN